MGFNNIGGTVKLNNIKTFNNAGSKNNVFKTQFYDDIKDIDYSKYEEIDYSNSLDLENNIAKLEQSEWYEVAAATGCVGVTTVISGVLKILEAADDGMIWLSGMTVSGVSRLFGQDEFAENFEEMIMDEIARDKVGEINTMFYENTEVGRAINEASAMKYDSELANGIQNVTTEAVIIAGATAATVATGGAAAPLFLAGFAVGAGQSAEQKYQDKENRDFWKDSVEIGVDGTIKGLSTMSYGKAGAAAVNGVKSLSSIGMAGIKELAKSALKSFSKDAMKDTIKNSGKTILKNTAADTLKDKDTWLETGAVLLDDVKTGLQTGDWNMLAMLGDVSLIFGENYIGNLGGNALGDVVNSTKNNFEPRLEASMMDRIKNKAGFKNQGKISDKAAFDFYSESLEDAIKKAKKNGNKDVQNMLEKLYLLEKKRPGWQIKVNYDGGSYSEAYTTGSLYLGKDTVLGKHKGVVYHELGHTLHGAINDSKVPENYMYVKSCVERNMFQNSGYVAECMNYLQNVQNHCFERAATEFDTNMANSIIQQLYKNDYDSVIDVYRKAGFTQDEVNELLKTDLNEQYQNIRNREIFKLADNYQHETGIDAVSDIIASEFNGNKRFAILDNNGNKVYLGGDTTYAHEQDYYTKIKDDEGNLIRYKTLEEINVCAFHEQIANYVELKLLDDKDKLNMLNNLFGNEWTQMMETEFNKILNYFK